MLKVKIRGFIKGGVLSIYNRKRLLQEIRNAKDCDVEITIKKVGKRSLPQNNYYFGVVVEEIRHNFLERGVRMDAEQVHEFLKLHFNKVYVHDDYGEVLAELPGSTTELNKEQFGEYLERIMQWASEKLGLTISEPNTQTQIDFTNDKAA